MRVVRQIVRWRLLPLLVVGIANVFVWYRGFVPQVPTLLTTGALVLAVVAGTVTPSKGLWWFSTLCLMLPPLFIENRHGALIFHLLGGFFFPPSWIYFLMNFAPVYVACAVFVLAGCGLRKVAGALILPNLGRSRSVEAEVVIVSAPTRKLIASGLPFFGVALLGNWIGFMMTAVNPANMPATLSIPQTILVPGVVVGMVVSKIWGTDAGQLATAVGNGAIYGLAAAGGRRLYNTVSQFRTKP